MFNSPRSRLWRWQHGEFARRNGCTEDGPLTLSKKFGKHWVFHKREDVMNLEPPTHLIAVAATHETEAVSLWDIWHGDRIARAAVVAEETGCTQGEAYCGLFQTMKRTMEFEVPAWRGERVNRAVPDDFSDVTLIVGDVVTKILRFHEGGQRDEAGP